MASLSTVTTGRLDIVLLDDDEDLRGTLAELLQGAGYSVLALGDWTRLAAVLDRGRPRLLLLDLTLPGAEPDDLAALLRESRGTGETVVYAMSGMDGAAELAEREGWAGVLGKPFDLDVLLALADRVCRSERAAPPPGAP